MTPANGRGIGCCVSNMTFSVVLNRGTAAQSSGIVRVLPSPQGESNRPNPEVKYIWWPLGNASAERISLQAYSEFNGVESASIPVQSGNFPWI